METHVGFWIAAVVSVGSALGVILHRNPTRAALFLIVNFVCLGFLYLLLNAQLLAALQILVYAGAIMVLFLFVIMLLNLGGEQSIQDPLSGQKGMAVVLGAFLLAGLGYAVNSARSITAAAPERAAPADEVWGADQVAEIGRALMTDYVYPFELTSILLLVGIVGSVLLARRRGPGDAPGEGEGRGGS